uniref:Uncharacterized protein n=1 Tax=Anguilla anguilla TaxID=7936 RepID=A0A0E9X1B4_ANGAN
MKEGHLSAASVCTRTGYLPFNLKRQIHSSLFSLSLSHPLIPSLFYRSHSFTPLPDVFILFRVFLSVSSLLPSCLLKSASDLNVRTP